MNLYYQALMQEIHELIEKEAYSEALDKVQAELDIPYVPKQELELLEDYKKECLSHIEKPAPHHEMDVLIHGTMEQQEAAVSMMADMNLRNMQDQVQTLLDSKILLNEIKGELIEHLMEQKIDTSYTMKRSGLELTFVPSLIIDAKDDQTLIQIHQLFADWFENDNPTFYQFCCRLLEQEVLENRPFDFTDRQALPIAKAIVRLVSEAFGQSEEFKQFVTQHQLGDVADEPLIIESRGEQNEK